MSKFRDSDAEESAAHDVFNPGTTSKQRQRADEMLRGGSLSLFVEQRMMDQEFRPGVLIGPDGSEPVEIAVSPMVDDDLREHIVLCEQPLRSMKRAEIVMRQAGRQSRLIGPLTISRPGRRDEDRKADPPIHVARFYDTA